MAARTFQLILVASLQWTSWLLMMLVHESGHVLGALCTGGHVRHLFWHPFTLSRTDVFPNPHPLIEVWAGPIVGCAVPLLCGWIASACGVKFASAVWVFAGFCLIANGAYIGIGAIWPVGDAAELVSHGMPRWVLGVFGVATVIPGFWIWHCASPEMGFGKSPVTIGGRQAVVMLVVALVVTLAGLVLGGRET